MLTPPGFGSPQALRTEQTGARSAYAASPKALIAKPTTASYAPSTPLGWGIRRARFLAPGGSMVCHALARVSAATMSTTMRLRSSMVRVPPSHCGCATPIGLLYNLQGDLYNISASTGIDFSLENGWKAADGTVFRASVATLVLATKSPLDWGRARWSEGSLFGHWRSGVAFVQVSCRSTRRGVREHPAPSGALRHVGHAGRRQQ